MRSEGGDKGEAVCPASQVAGAGPEDDQAMSRTCEPTRVKLFVAVLWSDREGLDAALARLATAWGPVDVRSEDFPFDSTDYYEAEMGRNLLRTIVSFSRLVSPGFLAEAKRFTNRVEDELRGRGGRRVNLDVGYLDTNKIVLASVKYAGQKIYLSHGIYADLALRYAKGRFFPFDWTFLDLRSERYHKSFLAIRERYKAGLRGPGGGPRGVG